MGIRDTFLDILFPPKCVFCGKLTDPLTDENKFLCSGCASVLPWTTKASGVTNGSFFVKCVSPLFYRGVVRDSIHRFKFGKQESNAGLYGMMIAACLVQHPDIKFDLITWVPLSRRRFWQRGFNQAQSIAESVALCTGTPLWKTLKKTRHTAAQSSLKDSARRRANIAGAYAVIDSVNVSGLSLLLIDDVVTTSSTLSECSRMLLMAGAEKVYCATLAKAGTAKVRIQKRNADSTPQR